MNPNDRRAFLADVGRGMLVASLGPALAADLGLASVALAEDREKPLQFGNLEPLAGLLQDTPADKLLPVLVGKLREGLELRTLIAAGALANARQFGGRDYEGFHTFMALAPALEMAKELPEDQRTLPVLKVLYRNTARAQTLGGRGKEQLHELESVDLGGKAPGEAIQDATRRKDPVGERMLIGLAERSPADAFNAMLYSVQDQPDVHRVVLAWRAWATLDLTGPEHARTLLRQSVNYCCHFNRPERNAPIETQLPKLMDQYRLAGRSAGDRQADDGWVESLAKLVYGQSRERAAEAVAAALAEGFAPDHVAEAIGLAANMLLLHDVGRDKYTTPEKPKGSVHGDSIGLHASDAANAWRNIAKASNARNGMASLIVAAYHTAGQSGGMMSSPYPHPEHREAVRSKNGDELIRLAEEAIRARDQVQACACVARYAELGLSERPMFDLLLKYATSEDGALHAEKYYRTVTEEFTVMRPAFRWRQVIALARVTASQFGKPAPGITEAKALLNG